MYKHLAKAGEGTWDSMCFFQQAIMAASMPGAEKWRMIFPMDQGWFFFCFLVVLGFDLNSHLLGRHATTLATPSALFCVGYFRDRISQTIRPGWL
jgi:hypothetical protein